MNRSIPYSIILALSMSMSAVAMADPSAADKLTAKALFEAAQDLTKAGKYEDACPKLAESQKLDPSLGTEFYLADCYEHIGKISTAWIYYEEVAGLAQAAGQKARADFAHKRADALKPRIPKLMIEVAAPSAVEGLVVKRDQAEVSRQQFGLPISVDPGSHTISAEAKGKKPWSVKVDVKEGATETVKVPALEDQGAAVTPSPPPPPPAKPAPAPIAPSNKEAPPPPVTKTPPVPSVPAVKDAPSTPPPAGRRSNVPAYVLAGLGGASLVTGIALAVTGKVALDDFNKNSTTDNADKVDSLALGADIGFAGAALLGSSSVIWWLGTRAPDDPKPVASQRSKIIVLPAISRSGVAVFGGLTF